MQAIVSVIIPTYNVEPFIEKALVSVLKQTYQNFEIIIVDDCSKDSTIEVIQKFNDPRIKISVNSSNSGPSFSRNKAIQLSRGKWIGILDGDDWWEESRLEKLVHLAEHYNADIVCDDFYYVVDDVSLPWGSYFNDKQIPLKQTSVCGIKELIDYDFGPLKPLFRKSFLSDNALEYHTDISYGEDFLLLFEGLLHNASMVVIPEPYYYRRAREGSLTAHRIRSTEKLIDLTKQLVQEIKSGKYPLQDTATVVKALEDRLARQTNALLYHQLITPFKSGKYLNGSVKLLQSLVARPATFAILAKTIPDIIDYRILRHFRKH